MCVSHLLECSPHKNRLVFPSTSYDLASNPHSRRLSPAPGATFVLNEAHVDAADIVDAVVTTARDVSLSTVYHRGELLHSWGNTGLHILPLHRRDLIDDDRHVEEQQHETRLFVLEHTGIARPYYSQHSDGTRDDDEEDGGNEVSASGSDSNSSSMSDSENDTNGEDLMSSMVMDGNTNDSSTPPPPPPFTQLQLNSSGSDGMPASPPAPGECASGVPHFVEIAFAYDNSLCRFYNYDAAKTLSMLVAMVDAAAEPFIRDTCARFALVYVDAHCRDPNDPYAALRQTATFFLANEFMAIWRQPQYVSIRRDVTYFVSGFNDGTSSLGFAWPGTRGGVCNPMLSFGWVEGIIPGVLANEFGHTLGARRSTSGLMFGFYEPRSTIPALASDSIALITTFLDDNPLSGCVGTTAPVDPLAPPLLSLPVDYTPPVFPEYGTCAVSRRMAHVLACTRRRTVGHVFNATHGRAQGLGTLRVYSWQEFGTFKVDVRPTRGDVSIHQFRGLQSMNGSITTRTVRLRPDVNVTKLVKLRREDVRIRWPRPVLTCCGFRLFVYINARWCRDGTSRCATKFQRLSRRVHCRSPCYGQPGKSTGTVLPMSVDRRCPACTV